MNSTNVIAYLFDEISDFFSQMKNKISVKSSVNRDVEQWEDDLLS